MPPNQPSNNSTLFLILLVLCALIPAVSANNIEVGANTTYTSGNLSYIESGEVEYVPFPVWLTIFGIGMFSLFAAVFVQKGDVFTCMIAILFFLAAAYASLGLCFYDYQYFTTYDGAADAVTTWMQPVVLRYNPVWLSYLSLGLMFLSIYRLYWGITMKAVEEVDKIKIEGGLNVGRR